MGGHRLRLGENKPVRTALNMKNRASLANKVTMSVSPKVMQLDLCSKMFSAKQCSSGPIK